MVTSALKSSYLSPPTREWSWRLRIALPLCVLLGFFCIAAVGYRVIEAEYSWLDAAYMTFISISTVGYHEVHPLSDAGRVWTMFVVAGGLVTGAVMLSMIVAMFVEGQLRSILGRKQLERRIAGLSGHTIVCGFGNTGRMVAQELKAAGRDVVVVENDPACTPLAEAEGMLYVLGDAQDETILAAAGIERASYLVGTLPTDAENVFLTLSARQLNGDLEIAVRAKAPSTQDKLLKAGANRVICPQTIGATRMANVVLRPAVVDFVEMAHKGLDLELEQLQLVENSGLVGKTLQELALPRRLGVQIVAIRREDGETIYHPTSELELLAGDTLVLIGQRGVVPAVEKLEVEAG